MYIFEVLMKAHSSSARSWEAYKRSQAGTEPSD